jgi:hypothetical protein
MVPQGAMPAQRANQQPHQQHQQQQHDAPQGSMPPQQMWIIPF